jgi:uncharacterized protein (DUF2147 family)
MKRSACVMVLIALTTPANAGSYSFVIGGHHIHVEAPRNCRSLSCVSWSDSSKKRGRDDAAAAAAAPEPVQAPVATVAPAVAPVAAPSASSVVPAPAPAVVPAPAPVAVRPASPAPQPQVAAAPVQTQPMQTQPAPAPVRQQAATAAPPALKPVETRAVVTPPAPQPAATTSPAPPPPAAVEAKTDQKTRADYKAEAKPRVGFDLKPDAKLEPRVEQKVETKPETTASVTKTSAVTPQSDKPVVTAKPAPSKTSLQSEGDGIEAPIGDWQTEGHKGLVRVEPCGTALCGYMINTSTNTRGEMVLINMKPKVSSQWSGSIYSRASGNTYYATMTMKRPNTLRVEACIVGHFFCSGNNWTRVTTKPDEIISPRESREASAEPIR